MAFVNEFIPAEDVEKYDLKAVDKNFIVGRTRARDWTIDRERNIYLRNVAIGGGADPDLRNQTTWTFYWRGDLLNLRLDLLDGGAGESAEHGWSHWKLVWLNGSHGLPAHLKPKCAEILDDLKEALVAYQGFGVYSRDYTSYRVALEVDSGCVL